MSTYLKTAAMSLLSRTLQTFLSKYLSDVDVEGVALPSVYDGSGWGLRLSNVKLREGVQLMKQMPGKVTKKRKRRRKRPKVLSATTRRTGVTPTPGDGKERQGDDQRVKKQASTDGSQGVGDDDDENDDDSNNQHNGENTFNAGRVTPAARGDGQDGGHAGAAGRSPGQTRRSLPTVSEGGDSSGFHTDDEIDYDSDGAARPSTPVQESKSFLSCFYNSNSTSSTRNKLNDNSLHAKDDTTVTKRASDPAVQTSSASFTSDSSNELSNGPFSAPGTTVQPLQDERWTKENESGSAAVHGAQDTAAEDLATATGRQFPPQPRQSHEKHQKVDDDDYHDEAKSILEDEYEEEEYEEEYDLPVRLCLGEGGRIGTIDVRLIGKELHVMVEDAFVTIEAIPIISEPDHDESGHAGGANAGGDDDAGVGGGSRRHMNGNQQDATSASDGGSNATATNTKKKAEPKRDTVGDRVLADNPLARLISSIPHLFLRDIRVRLIVRDQAMPAPREDSEKSSSASTERSSGAKNSRSQPSPKDTMVEVGIDFLSVTSGEDVLSHFSDQVDEEFHMSFEGTSTSERSSTAGEQSKPPPLLDIPSYARADSTAMVEQTNEYLVRHIRTGRGPSAGIFVQIFGADTSLPAAALAQNHVSNPDSSFWARQHWMLATEYHFMRLSGLDIRARIHLGTKSVDTGYYSWFYGDFIEDEGTDYDSMILLGGMESVAPGPQLPLPPMEPRMSRGSTPRQNVRDSSAHFIGETEDGNREIDIPSSMHPGADVYVTDQNGIQSCRVPSLFHRVSRGMEPKSCKECQHLPSGVCDLCWAPSRDGVKEHTDLDLSLPMPGLTLQIGFRDPVEINVDRATLESLGVIKSLFIKPSLSENAEQESSRVETKEDPTILAPAAGRDEATQTTTSSTGFFSGILYGRSKETIKEEEPSESFSAIMEPENITVMGIYASEIALRIHVMRDDKRDRGLSFCYWNLDIDCLTVDRQTLNTREKLFQDVELDIGRLVWDEFRGTGRKNVVTLGLAQPHRRRCDSQSSKSSMIEDHEHNRTPWPSAACALLDIPPPLESLDYKSRERHGVQLRFVSLSPNDIASNASKSLIHLRLGVTDVDLPWAVRTDIDLVVHEIMNHVVRAHPVGGREKADDPRNNAMNSGSPAREKKNSEDTAQEGAAVRRTKSLMAYTIQIDGGKIALPPLIDLKLPLTKFSGERSSEAGIFFETVLEKLELAYGSKEPKITKKCLSLPQIAALPESARMHILFCLKDISALERALFVKKEKNSFRRIKAVDKGILKMAKKISKRDSKLASSMTGLASTSLHGGDTSTSSGRRRQQILSEIMKLDDAEMKELWTVHQRYQRKLAKKRHEG